VSGGVPVRTIHQEHHHFGWDNSIQPVVTIAPGDELAFEIVDASGGQLTAESTAADVAAIDFGKVNPVTGPVYIDGAQPGDVLVVDILGFSGGGWGWTAIIPGFGLLADEFPEAHINISKYDEKGIEFRPGIRLPYRPFTGTIGVALAEPGQHSVVPPRRVGGNMDIRDLVPGSRLYLPVEVPGALFSVGDTHAAQGDGEVCGTAIETALNAHLRFGLIKQANQRFPRFETPTEASPDGGKGYYVTTGIGPDLMQGAKDATREMIDYLMKEHGLDAPTAYMLCSVAAHLRISEVVDMPNWVVSMYLPKAIFG